MVRPGILVRIAQMPLAAIERKIVTVPYGVLEQREGGGISRVAQSANSGAAISPLVDKTRGLWNIYY